MYQMIIARNEHTTNTHTQTSVCTRRYYMLVWMCKIERESPYNIAISIHVFFLFSSCCTKSFLFFSIYKFWSLFVTFLFPINKSCGLYWFCCCFCFMFFLHCEYFYWNYFLIFISFSCFWQMKLIQASENLDNWNCKIRKRNQINFNEIEHYKWMNPEEGVVVSIIKLIFPTTQKKKKVFVRFVRLFV